MAVPNSQCLRAKRCGEIPALTIRWRALADAPPLDVSKNLTQGTGLQDTPKAIPHQGRGFNAGEGRTRRAERDPADRVSGQHVPQEPQGQP